MGVASREHVLVGVEGGFAQLCHGKHAPVKRLQSNDYLVYYSPKIHYEPKPKSSPAADAKKGGKPGASIKRSAAHGGKGNVLQCFTSLGKVANCDAYASDRCAVPANALRRDVAYLPIARELPMAEVKPALKIADEAGKNWGLWLRRGVLEIGPQDFLLIAKGMLSKKDFADVERDVALHASSESGPLKANVCSSKPAHGAPASGTNVSEKSKGSKADSKPGASAVAGSGRLATGKMGKSSSSGKSGPGVKKEEASKAAARGSKRSSSTAIGEARGAKASSGGAAGANNKRPRRG